MYCKSCGHELAENEEFCSGCGAKRGAGKTYCENCGERVDESATVCPHCQAKIQAPREPKSKLVAGLLAIFLGAYGVHNFYLGYTKKATIQCAVSVACTILACCTFGITLIGVCGIEIWAFVEGIMILAGKQDKDGYGNPLKE